MEIAVVDSGPLYAAVDADDDDHTASARLLVRQDLRLVVPALVVAEVTYLIGRRLGAVIESRFLGGLDSLTVQAPYRSSPSSQSTTCRSNAASTACSCARSAGCGTDRPS